MLKRPAKRGDAYEFDAAAVHRWLVERAVRAVAGGEEGGDTATLTVERTRLARAQADAQEMKNQASRGELLPRDEVTAAVIAAFTRVRARLLALPTRAAPLVANKRSLPEIKQTLTELVHEALRELSETEVVAIAAGDEAP